jgi:metallo-beta-lactamase family protein
MKLNFYGGIKNVTGANYLIESGETKIIVDCGLKQGGFFCNEENWESFKYDPKEITAVLVTHAHIDHTGLLPKLIKEGFSGKIYSTPPTKDFAKLLLLDSENILSQEAKRCRKKPLYTDKDIEKMMSQWESIDYYDDFNINGVNITFHNAGHILGSSIITIEIDGKKIVFTGDMGNSPPQLINDIDILEEADYCVVEAAYGDRIHKPVQPGVIEDLIEDIAKDKGVLMIPSFAMERTQKLLYEMNDLFENGRVPKVPVFLDSPLAIKITDVYKKYKKYFNKEASDILKKDTTLFDFPGFTKSLTSQDSIHINSVPAPKIIIAGSGMSQGGRILHHEKRYLSDPKNIILFIGYQVKNSLGRKIQDGEPVVDIYGSNIPVKCRIVSIENYSAHADQKQILSWLEPLRFSLKKVFVVQGDEDASLVLSNKVINDLAINAEIPEEGKSYEL